MKDHDNEITIANVVGMTAFLAELLSGPIAVEFFGAPEYYNGLPAFLFVLVAYGVYKGGVFGMLLVDIVFLPIQLAMWPFQRADDVDLFSSTKSYLRGKEDKTKLSFEDIWGRRFEGFILGVTSSIAATYLLEAVKAWSK